jgi:hypothetical protein
MRSAPRAVIPHRVGAVFGHDHVARSVSNNLATEVSVS